MQAGKTSKAETKKTPTIFKAKAMSKPKTTVVQNLIFSTLTCWVLAKSSFIMINKISLKKQYKSRLYLIIAFDWVRTSDVPEENGL